MSEPTINEMVRMDKDSFKEYNEFVATKIEDAIFRSLAEYLHMKLANNDSAKLELPWGTYYAEIKDRGEAGVVNIRWEPSDGFEHLLNGDNDATSRFDRNYQDTFDPEYVKLFTDYMAYGMFYPEENKEEAAKNHLIMLNDAEVTYFLNGYALVLYNIAKEKQRDGKMYRLEICDSYPHGSFTFKYEGDEIKVDFIANKVFKQHLKDDAAAEKARTADFTKKKAVTVEYMAADEDAE